MKPVVVSASNKDDFVLVEPIKKLMTAILDVAPGYAKDDPAGYCYYCGYLDALYFNIPGIGYDHLPSVAAHNCDEYYLAGRADAIADLALNGIFFEGYEYEFSSTL